MTDLKNRKLFLFSIDLEDIRLRMENGLSYKERVPHNVERFLKWLDKNKAKCTFFTTGDLAILYPGLVNEIAFEGHEIACHTHLHIPLDKQTPSEFKRDMEENIEALTRAGVKEQDIKGFRAPFFSLFEKTLWAYEILAGLNFTYSSSVLPARNPLYGWEAFGHSPKRINSKMIEIPITVGRFGPMTLPATGGIYFRVMPEFAVRNLVKKKLSAGLPILSYFHPYDIDTEQEKFTHPGINNPFYNFLINYNRKNVFNRLDKLMEEEGLEIITYKTYANSLHEKI